MRPSVERWVRLGPVAAALGALALGPALVPELTSRVSGYGIGVGLLLGGVARVLRRRRERVGVRLTTVAVALVGVSLFAWPLARDLARHGLASEWRVAAAWPVLASAPLAVALVALASSRRLAAFAVGAALTTMIACWYAPPTGALSLLAFLFARDVGSLDDAVPARQTLALLGVGSLAVVLALALSFDLASSLAAVPRPAGAWWHAHVDGLPTRGPRIAIEALALAACGAHARGRTWGVLGLLGLGPALLALGAATDSLPAIGGGCIVTPHPLDGATEPLVVMLGLATLPWLSPIVRALRAPTVERERPTPQ